MKLTDTHKKIILIVAALCGVVVAVNVSAAPSNRKAKSKWRFSKYPLLWDTVLRGEAKTWNDYNFYTSKLNSRVNAKDTLPFSSKLLTEMTIGKVIEYQSMSRSGKGQLWATGHFQIIPSTLKAVYGKARLNLDSIYNEQNQTKIADALVEILQPGGVIVIIDCEHLCMSMRGVRKSQARTTTSAVRGQLLNPATRAEAISLINQSR